MTHHRFPGEPKADIAARVRVAFRVRPVDDGALKAAVYEYVDETKDLGWPVERIIVNVRRLAEAEREILLNRPGDIAHRLSELQSAANDAVTWCIERYFANDRG